MKELLKEYLFTKRVLVNDTEKSENIFETLFSLAQLFDIRITAGQELVTPEMIAFVQNQLGENVPEPFYRGFPQTARNLSPDSQLFDQLLHYTVTYGWGNFSEAGHSLFEEQFERAAFKENGYIEEFQILSENDAKVKLEEYIEALLMSTRPVNDVQYKVIRCFIEEYSYQIANCANKDTVVKLLLDTREVQYARFMKLSDVYHLVDWLNYEAYGNDNVKKLNLKNKDRKLITAIMNRFFVMDNCNVRECYEKKAFWCGLLHHIHYQPINAVSDKFVECMRSKGNESVFAEFEALMMQERISEATACLRTGKGSGAVLRKLNYILSRCKSEKEIEYVMEQLQTNNPMILIQLLMQYANYKASEARTFKFTKHNTMRVHTESAEEQQKRKSVISEDVIGKVVAILRKNLKELYKNKLGKVYIDEAMKQAALPLQENTSMGGFGVLPKGTRIPIEAGKKLRAFTYWEQVNDIDLSVMGIDEEGRQTEFSWRSMYGKQSEGITYSGDETSGYNGGSEYFDIDLEKMKKQYPKMKYLIFCNNVYSRVSFGKCLCKAGYMLREIEDSGEVFEPKTVKTSFRINCDSIFAYLFGIDLEKNDFIWLNVSRDSDLRVAGESSVAFLLDYFKVTEVLNMYDLFTMLATEVVDNPKDAEVVVSDKEQEVAETVTLIRSYDFEKVIAYMNGGA